MWLVYCQHQRPPLLHPADLTWGRQNKVCLRPLPLSLPAIFPSDSHSQFQAPPERPSPWPRVDEWGRIKSRTKRAPSTILSLPSLGRRETMSTYSVPSHVLSALKASFPVTPPQPLALRSNADIPPTGVRPLLFLYPFTDEEK